MERLIAVDLAEVTDATTGDYVTTLAWGDRVDVLEETDDHVDVRLTTFEEQEDRSRVPRSVVGRIVRRGRRPVVGTPDEVRVLKVDFVDVQQGDGAVMQTPGGKVMLIDGGENQMFARYLAGKFRDTSAQEPKVIDAIVVSHGDADHFAGLPEIAASEELRDEPTKQLFIKPLNVFHNGLVKRGARGREPEELFGRTVDGGERPLIVELEEDLLAVGDEKMNTEFVAWKRALEHWRDTQGPIGFRRLERGDDAKLAFLSEPGLHVEVLGPLTVEHGNQRGLPFLGAPLDRLGHPATAPRRYSRSPSPSHTINGHSIVLRIVYGRWSLLFAGDLNEQSEEALVELDRSGRVTLRSEVLKVPHHGSADFLHDFLDAVSPVVSVVSSGDDTKEFIHPRATLMTGLGRHSRSNDPVLFVTELVAYFRSEGWVERARPRHPGDKVSSRRGPFFGFSREAFGTVRVRTDGTRLLVYTDSGLPGMKEAYAYLLDERTNEALPQKLIRP